MAFRDQWHGVVLLCIGLSLMVAGCAPGDPTLKGPESIRVTRVKTVAVAPIEVDRITQQPATVYPYFETEIRGRVGGYVTELNVDLGDYVKAGQVLARIDVPELIKQSEVLKARVRLQQSLEEVASSEVRLHEAAVESSKAKFEQSKSELGRVEAALAAAQSEFLRTEDLVQKGSLQSRVLDEVRKRRDSEAAGAASAKSLMESAKAEIVVAEAEKAAAEARLKAARAESDVASRELEEMAVRIDYAAVKAPFDGLVTDRFVNPGDLIVGESNTGDAILFVLSQVDKVRIQIPVPETQAPFVQPGDSVVITFPSFESEQPISTKITRVSGQLDSDSRTMIVEAEWDNSKGKFLPGMFGQAVIGMETKVATKVLPSRAVRFDESGNAFVYRLTEDNRINVIEVKTGLDTGAEIEILSGLDAGQIVVDSHLKRFQEGEIVQPL